MRALALGVALFVWPVAAVASERDPLAGAPPLDKLPPEQRERAATFRNKLKERQDKIDAAVERGIEALMTKFDAKAGHWASRSPNPALGVTPTNIGEQALVILTLAKCGRGPKDRVVEKALRRTEQMLGREGPQSSMARSYELGTFVMAVRALYNPDPEPEPINLASQSATWGKHKTWKAAHAAWIKRNAKSCPRKLRKVVQGIADSLVQTRLDSGFHYYAPGQSRNGIPAELLKPDMSNTQWVLLALRDCAYLGVVPSTKALGKKKSIADVYRETIPYFGRVQEDTGEAVILRSQNPDWLTDMLAGKEPRYGRTLRGPKVNARGFCYRSFQEHGDRATGSMTMAAVAALLITKEKLQAYGALSVDERAELNARIRSGLAWMTRHFQVDRNPRHLNNQATHYYYLYGLERAMSLGGSRL